MGEVKIGVICMRIVDVCHIEDRSHARGLVWEWFATYLLPRARLER